MRVMLASLAALVVVGCGPAHEEAASGPDASDPGVIVFNGGWYLDQQSGPGGYHEIRPDGTGVRKLAFVDEDLTELVTLSPDGRFVASVVKSFEDDKEWGDALVFVSRLDGSERRLVPLPNDGVLFASVSPGGKNLALAYTPDMFNGPSDVWTASVSGDDFEQQTSIGNVQTVAWAPDGQHLVIMDEPRDEDGGYDGNGDIYIMQVDGSDLHRVARGSDPVWSPDGEHIAFADNDRNVSIVDGTGEDLRVVVRNGRSPVWSPDGKRLAFLRRTECGHALCYSGIFIVDAGGGLARRVGPTLIESTLVLWTAADLPKLSPASTKTNRRTNQSRRTEAPPRE